MEFDGFFFILIGLAVLSAFGSLAWWFFIAWAGYKVVSSATANMDVQIAEIMRAIQDYSAVPMNQRSCRSDEIGRMLWKMNDQMRHFDQISRDRYDLRMGELTSMAAGAGIDWRPS